MDRGYPRPQFRRDNWQDLNGEWDFSFDDSDAGISENWNLGFETDLKIIVPFCYESKLSGINTTEVHKIIWYHREFMINDFNKKTILHFGAVDYKCTIYINGKLAFTHTGGNVSFQADITKFAILGKVNHLTLRVFDDMEDLEIPRGKQYWKRESESIYYTRTSGIWQSVWLEEVNDLHLKNVKMLPLLDEKKLLVSYNFSHAKENHCIKTVIKFNNNIIVENTDDISSNSLEHSFDLSILNDFDEFVWSPENPNLFDIEFYIYNKLIIVDSVVSYFGMRKISIENNRVKLNNNDYYMKLVLDQGYYPESLLTAVDDKALIQDIILTKNMGFNGVRKHQKIEEERYLYFADKYGLLVWEELPSAYEFSKRSVINLKNEWKEALNRDYNHPCIVAWVPMNESWGTPNLENSQKQIDFLDEMYNLTKSIDDSRIVISNDGWEHSTTDLLTIHDYESSYDVIKNRYNSLDTLLVSKPGYKSLFNKGYKHQGEPILVTEFGGISFQRNGQKGWGYSSAGNHSDFEERLSNVIKPICESKLVQGFCYTQLTDVEQEINGLLTYDRLPKLDVKLIKKLIDNK